MFLSVFSGTSCSRKEKKRNKASHKMWSSKEKEAVFRHLKRFVAKKELPGKLDCLNCIQKSSPVLDNREWTAVKYFVKNVISRAETLKKKGQN